MGSLVSIQSLFLALNDYGDFCVAFYIIDSITRIGSLTGGSLTLVGFTSFSFSLTKKQNTATTSWNT